MDITNFFTYDRNRPLHVFDADKVSGNLRVHRAKGGETLMALDEKEYTFAAGMVVISDDSGVESIGGIMGGLATGCTGETSTCFLEAASGTISRSPLTGRGAQDQLGRALSQRARHRPGFQHGGAGTGDADDP